MKARTILATTVAVGAVAASTITGTASAVGCSNTAYMLAAQAGTRSTLQSVHADQNGAYATAAALELAAWNRLRLAPVPCNPLLRNARTHDLRMHVDYWMSEQARGRGDMHTALTFGKAGLHESDLSTADVVTDTP